MKKGRKQEQSTRQLMGIQQVTSHGVITGHGELVFFLVRPDNLSILSPEGIRERVDCLTNLFRTQSEVTLMALNSRESFQPNRQYYIDRLEEETDPAIRALLRQDLAHLDSIQATFSVSREFLLILRITGSADETSLRQTEKALNDHRIHVKLAEEQDVKRILSVYYLHDVTSEHFQNYDGEEYFSDA